MKHIHSKCNSGMVQSLPSLCSVSEEATVQYLLTLSTMWSNEKVDIIANSDTVEKISYIFWVFSPKHVWYPLFQFCQLQFPITTYLIDAKMKRTSGDFSICFSKIFSSAKSITSITFFNGQWIHGCWACGSLPVFCLAPPMICGIWSIIITSITQNDPLLGTNAPNFRMFPLCQATVIVMTSRVSTSIIKLAQKWLPPKSLSSGCDSMAVANLQNHDLKRFASSFRAKSFSQDFPPGELEFSIIEEQSCEPGDQREGTRREGACNYSGHLYRSWSCVCG